MQNILSESHKSESQSINININNIDYMIDAKRTNMLKQQIRPCNVLNPNVLDALYTVHREDFVPKKYRDLAFTDMRLQLMEDVNVKMLTPIMEGKILQALNITKNDNVLVVGTGRGYLAACAAFLGKHVTAIDINDDFTRTANIIFEQQNIANITCVTRSFDSFVTNQADSDSEKDKYDIVILTGSVKEIPLSLLKILNIENNKKSRLFAVIGDYPVMTACIFHNIETAQQSSLKIEKLFETDLERLIGYEDIKEFDFF